MRILKNLRHPIVLFALPAALAALAQSALVYERSLILGGEWWRLITGHWVHFSFSHAAWNLLVLLVAGAWLERLRPGTLLRFTLSAAPLLGIGLFAFVPAMSSYGGLSGLAVGVVVLLALAQLAVDGAARSWWFGALAVLAGKIATEAAFGNALFSDLGSAAVRPSVEAHLLGAVAAVVFHITPRVFRGLFSRQFGDPTAR